MEKEDKKESRFQGYAKECEKICKLIDEGPNGSVIENSTDSLSRLITLCSFMRGTSCLRDYVHDLLAAGVIGGFPRQLLINVAKGEYGIFELPAAKEFERKQILVDQPIAIKTAIRLGANEKAKRLNERLQCWKEEFEKLYGEPAHKGVDMEDLSRHLQMISGGWEKDASGESSS